MSVHPSVRQVPPGAHLPGNQTARPTRKEHPRALHRAPSLAAPASAVRLSYRHHAMSISPFPSPILFHHSKRDACALRALLVSFYSRSISPSERLFPSGIHPHILDDPAPHVRPNAASHDACQPMGSVPPRASGPATGHEARRQMAVPNARQPTKRSTGCGRGPRLGWPAPAYPVASPRNVPRLWILIRCRVPGAAIKR